MGELKPAVSFRARLAAALNVLRGRPTMYRVTLEPPVLRGADENEHLHLTANRFVAPDWELDKYEPLPVVVALQGEEEK